MPKSWLAKFPTLIRAGPTIFYYIIVDEEVSSYYTTSLHYSHSAYIYIIYIYIYSNSNSNNDNTIYIYAIYSYIYMYMYIHIYDDKENTKLSSGQILVKTGHKWNGKTTAKKKHKATKTKFKDNI